MPHTASTAPPLLWHADGLWAQLEPWLPGLSVEVLPHCDSTNTVLLERARAEHSALTSERGPDDLALVRRSRESAAFARRPAELPPCLLVAEHQRAGRGRMGRHWVSAPAGASLTFSLALPLPGDLSGLSLAVGLSLAEALEPHARAGQARIQLKWPNDLWLVDAPTTVPTAARGRKLGGILIETLNVGSTRQVVIGVGLNILPLPVNEHTHTHTPTADPTPTPAEPLAHGHASVHELDATLTAPAVLARVAPLLVRDLIAFQRGGFAPLAAHFAQRDLLRGQSVCTTQADTPEGTASGVADNGALRVVRADGSVSTIHSGEVSVRLQPTQPHSLTPRRP